LAENKALCEAMARLSPPAYAALMTALLERALAYGERAMGRFRHVALLRQAVSFGWAFAAGQLVDLEAVHALHQRIDRTLERYGLADLSAACVCLQRAALLLGMVRWPERAMQELYAEGMQFVVESVMREADPARYRGPDWAGQRRAWLRQALALLLEQPDCTDRRALLLAVPEYA
jgi:hypothetical protein